MFNNSLKYMTNDNNDSVHSQANERLTFIASFSHFGI